MKAKSRRKSPPVTLVSIKALAAVPTTTLNRDSDPTPERLAQAGASVAMQLGSRRTQIIAAPRGMVGADSVIRITQAPLDRLHARDQLDPVDPERNRQLFEAGEKLRTHHFVAGLSGYAAANDFGRIGGSDPFNRVPITEAQERHRRALRRAEDAMDAGDWQVVRDVVLAETTLEDAGHAIGYGNRHAASAVALDRLRRGLQDLAELWGFVTPRVSAEAPAAANDAVAAEAGRAVAQSA